MAVCFRKLLHLEALQQLFSCAAIRLMLCDGEGCVIYHCRQYRVLLLAVIYLLMTNLSCKSAYFSINFYSSTLLSCIELRALDSLLLNCAAAAGCVLVD